MKLSLVVSGGQSGADLAGNEFASEMGIATAIFAFKGFLPVKTTDTPLYEGFKPKNITVHSSDYVGKLRERTMFNVSIASATIIFVEGPIFETKGSQLTARYCELCKKPYYVVDFSMKEEKYSNHIRRWLVEHNPLVLNVAGSRDCDRKKVKNLLIKAWKGAVSREDRQEATA